MGAVTGMDAWAVDVDAVNALSKRLIACADALARSAGGVPRGLDVQQDRHDVRGAFVGLDEERERLDQQLSAYCREAASRLAVVALDAATADANSPFVHLPEAGY
jgi:hypothetical protein